MVHDGVGNVLTDFVHSRTPSGDPMLDAVQAAIFLEDVFGLTMTDEDISPESLGDLEAIRRTLDRKLRAG